MEVLEAIQTRRSIRHYQTAPVDDKTVEKVLDAARWAPSWANTQCWRFIVVRDDVIKTKLAATLSDTNPATDAFIVAPVIIVACAELGRSGYKRGNDEPATDKGDWYMFDVALAMQNLMLAAHALGLGTVHVGYFDTRQVVSILQVPQGFCVVEMTPLGYPDQQPKPRPRKEIAEITFNETWGGK